MKNNSIQNARLPIIDKISRIISDSIKPENTLQKIVNLIAEEFNVDVCSIYLLNPDKNHLVLRATVGLRWKSIDKIRMGIHEGLTGLVLEKMRPVFVINPSHHQRYKYFQETGEEAYKSFLGVPLIYHQDTLGVLVIQTLLETAISESDINVFLTIASQISATAAYTGLLNSLKMEKEQSQVLQKKLSHFTGGNQAAEKTRDLLRGLPVSAGFGEGCAQYLGENIGFDEVDLEKSGDIDSESKRLEEAFRRSREELSLLIKNAKDLSTEEKAVLDVQRMSLEDRDFTKKVVTRIREGYGAEYALKKVVMDYLEIFSRMEDPYLRERGRDIEDAGKSVLRNLLGIGGASTKNFEKETIIIASDVSPTDIVALRHENLKAIVLTKGGRTSHAVILARSFEIPMVIGAKETVERVKKDDFLIVDGTSGLVFVRPTKEIIAEYQRLKDEKAKLDSRLNSLKELPATTIDGHQIILGANIGLLSDLELVEKYGAENVGLYRTEFPFLAREKFPSEEAQFQLYKKIAEGVHKKEVVIRTLDVGGDKFLSYFDYPREKNPYLGWRSIRVSLELDHIFRSQIRAILRASAFGNIKVMFPMITSVKKIKQISSILEEEKISLKENKIFFDEEMKIGIMVEVPAAVKILDRLLRYVDFVSIGTNDLIQYTLAVDRNNPKVASLYNPLHPAVISTILEIVSICKKKGKSVCICGEAASNPKCAYLFLAMEVDQLSMNPASVPVIKDLIRTSTLKEAKTTLNHVLEMEDDDNIVDFLDKKVPR